MIDEKLVELSKWKEDKRNVFVNFKNGFVRWRNQTYKLTYIKVDGKAYPYVVVRRIKPLSKIRNEIKTINQRKNELKFTEYEVNGDMYFVIGIGSDAIRAYKNNSSNPEYLRYGTTRGQYLLREIISSLDGCVLC